SASMRATASPSPRRVASAPTRSPPSATRAERPGRYRMSRVTFLLPSRQRIEAPVAGSLMSRCLAQGDGADQREGTDAQFARHVDVLPRRLAMAAVSRQVDCGDAQGSSWLRADPVSLRADMTTGRLMAHGDLGLDADAVESLLSPLRPLFGDE